MRRLLLAALLSLALPSAAAAKPFTVGAGENPGIAIDDNGTIFVGWEVNPGGEGEQVQFCVVPPKATACAAPPLALPYPGQGYGLSRVSVLLPAPNVVDVIVPRNVGPLEYGAFLARSVDGGSTFGPPVKLSSAFSEQAVMGPTGRVALVGGPRLLYADSAPADGSGGAKDGAALGGLLGGQFNDIATTQAGDVIVAGSDPSTTHVFVLPAGADPDAEVSWQPLPSPLGRQPELAGGPAGLVAMLEASTGQPDTLFAQRLEITGWSPPVSVFDVLNNDFELSQTARGRLSAVRTASIPGESYFLEYAHSTDGGVLWSSRVRVATYGRAFPDDLELATAGGGRGAAVTGQSLDDHAIRVSRFTPRSAPVKRRTIRGRRVQVRSGCNDGKLFLVVEAARGARRVSPATVLRRARFGRTKRARPGFRTRFRARYSLRRRHATVRVRLVTRRGKDRTVRLRVRRCSATS